jgi:hypothetical protein
MKKLDLKPSNYTTDEIYTAFELLNARIDNAELDKLHKLNKMYQLIQRDLAKVNVDFLSYYFLEHSLTLKWEKKAGYITVSTNGDEWSLLSSPKEYRLLVEELLPTFIKSLVDGLNQ